MLHQGWAIAATLGQRLVFCGHELVPHDPPPPGLHEGDAIPGIEQLFPESQEEDVGDSAQAADKRDKVINQPLAVGEYVQT